MMDLKTNLRNLIAVIERQTIIIIDAASYIFHYNLSKPKKIAVRIDDRYNDMKKLYFIYSEVNKVEEA